MCLVLESSRVWGLRSKCFPYRVPSGYYRGSRRVEGEETGRGADVRPSLFRIKIQIWGFPKIGDPNMVPENSRILIIKTLK